MSDLKAESYGLLWGYSVNIIKDPAGLVYLNAQLSQFKGAHYSNLGIPETKLDYWEIYLVPPGYNHITCLTGFSTGK